MSPLIFSASYHWEEASHSIPISNLPHPEMALNPEDCAFEPGWFEEEIPTGELQADVPTDEMECNIPTAIGGARR